MTKEDDSEINLDEYRSNNASGYKGVYQMSDRVFEASVWVKGQKKRLGRFNTVEQAARAYARESVRLQKIENDPTNTSEEDDSFRQHPVNLIGEGWTTEGCPHIAAHVRRNIPNTEGNLEAINGRVTHWMPPGEDMEEDPALYHVLHEDGDEEDLEEHELKEAEEEYKKWQEETQSNGRGSKAGDLVKSVMAKVDRAGTSCGRYKHKSDCKCHLVVKVAGADARAPSSRVPVPVKRDLQHQHQSKSSQRSPKKAGSDDDSPLSSPIGSPDPRLTPVPPPRLVQHDASVGESLLVRAAEAEAALLNSRKQALEHEVASLKRELEGARNLWKDVALPALEALPKLERQHKSLEVENDKLKLDLAVLTWQCELCKVRNSMDANLCRSCKRTRGGNVPGALQAAEAVHPQTQDQPDRIGAAMADAFGKAGEAPGVQYVD